MQARNYLAAQALVFALSLSAVTMADAGDWLGGQYWGQIAGCAHCGGSLYGGALPPGAIWVGEIGCGGGPGCGCGAGKGDFGPLMTGEEVPTPTPFASPVYSVPGDTDGASAHGARVQNSSRPVSYLEALEPAESEFHPRRESVRVVTHTSQPERLRREPIRIVSPDGSAGRMFR